MQSFCNICFSRAMTGSAHKTSQGSVCADGYAQKGCSTSILLTCWVMQVFDLLGSMWPTVTDTVLPTHLIKTQELFQDMKTELKM